MPVAISRALADRLRALAAAEPGQEVCGLLLGENGRIRDIAPSANLADDVARAFQIDPAELFGALRAERAGGATLVGYYHSHPSGDSAPSATDLAQSDPDERLWLIIAGDELAAWRRSAAGFAPERLEIAPD